MSAGSDKPLNIEAMKRLLASKGVANFHFMPRIKPLAIAIKRVNAIRLAEIEIARRKNVNTL